MDPKGKAKSIERLRRSGRNLGNRTDSKKSSPEFVDLSPEAIIVLERLTAREIEAATKRKSGTRKDKEREEKRNIKVEEGHSERRSSSRNFNGNQNLNQNQSRTNVSSEIKSKAKLKKLNSSISNVKSLLNAKKFPSSSVSKSATVPTNTPSPIKDNTKTSNISTNPNSSRRRINQCQTICVSANHQNQNQVCCMICNDYFPSNDILRQHLKLCSEFAFKPSTEYSQFNTANVSIFGQVNHDLEYSNQYQSQNKSSISISKTFGSINSVSSPKMNTRTKAGESDDVMNTDVSSDYDDEQRQETKSEKLVKNIGIGNGNGKGDSDSDSHSGVNWGELTTDVSSDDDSCGNASSDSDIEIIHDKEDQQTSTSDGIQATSRTYITRKRRRRVNYAEVSYQKCRLCSKKFFSLEHLVLHRKNCKIQNKPQNPKPNSNLNQSGIPSQIQSTSKSERINVQIQDNSETSIINSARESLKNSSSRIPRSRTRSRLKSRSRSRSTDNDECQVLKVNLRTRKRKCKMNTSIIDTNIIDENPLKMVAPKSDKNEEKRKTPQKIQTDNSVYNCALCSIEVLISGKEIHLEKCICEASYEEVIRFCPICNRLFKNRPCLSTHYSMHHRGQKKLRKPSEVCKICQLKCSSKWRLESHMQSKHKESSKSGADYKNINNKGNSINYSNNNSNTNGDTNMYGTNSIVRHRERSASARRFACPVENCDKEFICIAHLNSHTNRQHRNRHQNPGTENRIPEEERIINPGDKSNVTDCKTGNNNSNNISGSIKVEIESDKNVDGNVSVKNDNNKNENHNCLSDLDLIRGSKTTEVSVLTSVSSVVGDTARNGQECQGEVQGP